MNIKLKALLYTVGFISGCAMISYALIWAVSMLSQQAVIWLGSGAAIAFLVYMMYNLILNKLEYDEKITEIYNNQSK